MSDEQVKLVEIKKGRVYHFKDSQESSVYQWAKEKSRIPLTITRTPDEVTENYEGSKIVSLLPGSVIEGSVSPTELAKLRNVIDKPLKSKDEMIIFGKGSIDYLVNQNDMQTITRFLESLRDGVYRTEGIVAAEINLQDADRKSAYKRLIRTAPLYEWPLGSVEGKDADDDEQDREFADELDKLIEKKVALSEKKKPESDEQGKDAPVFAQGWPNPKGA